MRAVVVLKIVAEPGDEGGSDVQAIAVAAARELIGVSPGADFAYGAASFE